MKKKLTKLEKLIPIDSSNELKLGAGTYIYRCPNQRWFDIDCQHYLTIGDLRTLHKKLGKLLEDA